MTANGRTQDREKSDIMGDIGLSDIASLGPDDQDNEVLTVNVGGLRHQVLQSTIQRYPKTKLAHLNTYSSHYRETSGEYFFDRHPDIFTSILNYYRVGELHLPTDVCKVVVQKELEYWCIDENLIEDCCWLSYNALWDQMHTLAQFDKKRRFEAKSKSSSQIEWFQKWQPIIWKFLEDPYYNKWSQIFAWVSLSFVLVSIFTFCAETHPTFMINMTVNEYAHIYGLKLGDVLKDAKYWDHLKDIINQSSHSGADQLLEDPGGTGTQPGTEPGCTSSSRHELTTEGSIRRQRSVVHAKDLLQLTGDVKQEHLDDKETQRIRRAAQDDVTTLGNTQETNKIRRALYIPWLIPNPILISVDYVCYCFFTFELAVRFIFCDGKRYFITSFFNIIDILAVFPFYIEIVINHLHTVDHHQKSFIDLLLFVRIIRIFRVFRLIRHNRGLQVLVYTIKASLKEIGLLIIFLGIGVVIFSSLIYYADHGSGKFMSIPHSFWWATITMTTVGYGDVVPSTPWGYLIGSFCALSGVMLIAFTVPVIVSNFMLIYQYVQFQRDNNDGVKDPDRWKPSNRTKKKHKVCVDENYGKAKI